jgi:hypothetical protein
MPIPNNGSTILSNILAIELMPHRAKIFLPIRIKSVTAILEIVTDPFHKHYK